MLTASAAVERLRPERKQELPSRMLRAFGDEPSVMAACPPGFLVRFILGQVRAALFPQTVATCFDVSAEWIAAQKAGAAADGEVPYVSTNDCVMSKFLDLLQPDH